MAHVSWTVAANGRYWMDLIIGARRLRFMVDLGLVDPANDVGLEIDPQLFEYIEKAGGFLTQRRRTWRDASGKYQRVDSGLLVAQLFDSSLQAGVGPAVRLFATKGVANLPNRVGVVFFHKLLGCSVTWNLDQRVWRIDYP
jgi:hypothetical protein